MEKKKEKDFYEALKQAREALKVLGTGKLRTRLIREGCRTYSVPDCPKEGTPEFNDK